MAVHVGDTFSTVGIPSVLWGIPSVLWRLFSTVGGSISTGWDGFSTVEGISYIGRIHSVHVGITSVQWGITSVLWRVLCTVGEFLILACLAIKNDEKISIFLYYETKFLFRSFENSNRFHAFLELDLFRNN